MGLGCTCHSSSTLHVDLWCVFAYIYKSSCCLVLLFLYYCSCIIVVVLFHINKMNIFSHCLLLAFLNLIIEFNLEHEVAISLMEEFIDLMNVNESNISDAVIEDVVTHIDLAMMCVFLGAYPIAVEHLVKSKKILFQYMVNQRMFENRLSVCASPCTLGTLFDLPIDCLNLIVEKLN